jgi:2-hydroxy-3-keto-5-methylthiopentenyl-1-phosphate phosphatase
MQFSISCDFDGTITLADTVDAVLDRFAEPEWEAVEADWKAGTFGSRECLAEQTKLLRMTPLELDAFLDTIEVDADAKGFFDDCFRMGLPVSVVSDGYDWAVRRILARAGIRGIPIVANRLIHMGEDRWMARFPHSTQNCGSGVCKCAVVNEPVQLIHIGDGRSDVCVSNMVDLVFAKGSLLKGREEANLPSIGFETFSEIRALLPDLATLVPAPAAVPVQRIA